VCLTPIFPPASKNVQKMIAVLSYWLYYGHVLDMLRRSQLPAGRRRARWISVSLYRRALGTAIPPLSCSFPVFNTSASIVRRSHTTPASGRNSAPPGQRDPRHPEERTCRDERIIDTVEHRFARRHRPDKILARRVDRAVPHRASSAHPPARLDKTVPPVSCSRPRRMAGNPFFLGHSDARLPNA
jgi:hypothetical protein